MCSLFFSKRIMLARPCNGMSTCYLCQMTDLYSLERGHLFKALVLAIARNEGGKEGRKRGREGGEGRKGRGRKKGQKEGGRKTATEEREGVDIYLVLSLCQWLWEVGIITPIIQELGWSMKLPHTRKLVSGRAGSSPERVCAQTLCALSTTPCCLSHGEYFLAYYPTNDFDQTSNT